MPGSKVPWTGSAESSMMSALLSRYLFSSQAVSLMVHRQDTDTGSPISAGGVVACRGRQSFCSRSNQRIWALRAIIHERKTRLKP